MTTPTILICDDEPAVGIALRRFMAFHGVEVLIDTSSDALHLAQFFQPQAILIDLLQWRDGLAMLQELKTDPTTRDIPVFVISGMFSEEDVAEEVCPGALALGALAVLPKPVPERFIESLAAFLHGGPVPGASATAGTMELAYEEVEVELTEDAYEFQIEVDLDSAA